MLEAIDYLRRRGHTIRTDDSGVFVGISPQTESQEVTLEDIEAINALNGVVELRVIAFPGIGPEVFKRFRVFPKVRILAVHYGMPEESLRHFDKFPNVEILRVWKDVRCDHLPPLPKLRVLDLETDEDELSTDCVRSIAACRNLEEINIRYSRLSEGGAALLKSLPRLRYLVADGEVLLETGGEPAPAAVD